MKILLVRHAEPDYTIDSLTPKGRREAELLSRRLCKLDVKNFYVSPQGRARDTASYTLNKLNRTAEVLPWLAEFRGRCFNPAEGRQDIPWDYRPREWNAHPEFYQPDAWLKNPQVQDGTVQAIWDETVAGWTICWHSTVIIETGPFIAARTTSRTRWYSSATLASVWRSLVIYAAFRPFRYGNASVCSPLP